MIDDESTQALFIKTQKQRTEYSIRLFMFLLYFPLHARFFKY